jgi:UDP-GlcNAc:undecaprenyl-phosphate/decaprenyl-phosphate GlcNAc-1-phosphate transferase
LTIPVWVIAVPSVIAFLTTFALVPQVRRFAIECRVADKPNGRKVHAHAIPHLGGVAIFSGFFFGLLVSLGSPGGAALGDRLLALLPALLVVFGLGMVDDLRGLRASTKLTYQVLAASLVLAMGAGFRAAPGAGILEFIALVAVGLFWYVGVCNSMNLIDGLDGLAAGTAGLAAVGFLIVAVQVGEPAVAVISVCLIGALVAFLRFNFHPARIFMGDTGSMFIGFTLAALSCILARHLGFWSALLGSAAMLGVPLLDTTSAVVRRLAAHRHIFEADGEHTHHRLMRAGLSHRGAVLALYALQAVFVVLGCGILMGRTGWFVLAVALGGASAFVVSYVARRMPAQLPLAPAVPVSVPAPALRAVPIPSEVRVAVHPAALHARSSQPAHAEEVLAEFPPAVAGGGPS